MKIAICISGFIRTWEYVKQSFIEQLAKGTDVDVFIHTYRQNLYEETADRQDVELSDEDFSNLFEGINVRKLVIEDRHHVLPMILKNSKKYSHIPNYGLLQPESSDTNSIKIPIGARTYDHLRKLYLCNEMRKAYERETGTKYDLVVKTRFDIIYFNRPAWETFLDGKIHCGYGATWGWPEDTFCAAAPELMDRGYAIRFTKMDDMFLGENPKVDGICSHGTLKYMYAVEDIKIGHPAVNILCFRSENSAQYGGNYRFKCNVHDLYRQMIGTGTNDVYLLEQHKRSILS